LGEDSIGFDSNDFNFYRYVGNNPIYWNDPMGLAQYCITKPEAHNGGKPHVHWGEGNNNRQNAVNKDGSVRHGKKPPKKVKKMINKKFNWKLKTLLINLTPFDNYEQFDEYLKCGENGCEA